MFITAVVEIIRNGTRWTHWPLHNILLRAVESQVTASDIYAGVHGYNTGGATSECLGTMSKRSFEDHALLERQCFNTRGL